MKITPYHIDIPFNNSIDKVALKIFRFSPAKINRNKILGIYDMLNDTLTYIVTH